MHFVDAVLSRVVKTPYNPYQPCIAEYTAKYARPEDVAGQEEGREGNDSMSGRSDGFLSSSDEEDEPPTTGEADVS